MTSRSGPPDVQVADLTLAESGRHEIRLAQREMPGLMALRRQYQREKPLAGVRITGSLHMTVQTAVLVETLTALGADVRWSGCNIFSTQDHAAAAVAIGPRGTPERPRGVPVFAWKGQTLEAYWSCIERALRWPDHTGPDFILDDGGDATLFLHEAVELERRGAKPDQADASSDEHAAVLATLARSWLTGPPDWTTLAARVRGVTEETTSGVHRLERIYRQGRLLFPAININDSVTKSKFDNRYGCRHSLIDGLNRGTDVLIGGKTAVVVGYGDVGKGSAAALRGQGARVVVVEVDPICALQAAMDGYRVARLEAVVDAADIFVTATGSCRVITVEHMRRMKHQAIVGNIGHFDVEVDMAGLRAAPGVQRRRIKPQVDEWLFDDGHSVIVLSEGRILNLGNATGHPSFVMSTSFTNQVLGQIQLHTGRYPIGVHRLPRHLDELVARLHLDALGAELSTLTQEQADYLGVTVDGPFKPEHYRY